ncbi:hypothetical protein HDU79_001409 [Rhizoclosmatium sp. JEL0117]|nr:hypothetical protein HDU79_001409 [Rhizoclosmatium sp. JEL0117]
MDPTKNPQWLAAMYMNVFTKKTPGKKHEDITSMVEVEFEMEVGNKCLEVNDPLGCVAQYTKVQRRIGNYVMDPYVDQLRASCDVGRAKGLLAMGRHKEAVSLLLVAHSRALQLDYLVGNKELMQDLFACLKQAALPPTRAAKALGEAAEKHYRATTKPITSLPPSKMKGLKVDPKARLLAAYLVGNNYEIGDHFLYQVLQSRPQLQRDMMSYFLDPMNPIARHIPSQSQLEELCVALDLPVWDDIDDSNGPMKPSQTKALIKELRKRICPDIYESITSSGRDPKGYLNEPYKWVQERATREAVPYFLAAADRCLAENRKGVSPKLTALLKKGWLKFTILFEGPESILALGETEAVQMSRESHMMQVLSIQQDGRVAEPAVDRGVSLKEALENLDHDDESDGSCCSYCGRLAMDASGGRLKSCAACRAAFYCTTECQKAHWKEHKVRCRESKEEPVLPVIGRVTPLTEEELNALHDRVDIESQIALRGAGLIQTEGFSAVSNAASILQNPFSWANYSMLFTRLENCPKIGSKLRVVDDVWHISLIPGNDDNFLVGMMEVNLRMLQIMPISVVEGMRHPTVEVTPAPIAKPEKPASYSLFGMLQMDQPKVPIRPSAPCAVRTYRKIPDEFLRTSHSGDSLADAICDALVTAVESRAGIPKRIVFGPHSIRWLEKVYSESSRLIELLTKLGVQEHYVEGWLASTDSRGGNNAHLGHVHASTVEWRKVSRP